jgi:hypothetical protein
MNRKNIKDLKKNLSGWYVLWSYEHGKNLFSQTKKGMIELLKKNNN